MPRRRLNGAKSMRELLFWILVRQHEDDINRIVLRGGMAIGPVESRIRVEQVPGWQEAAELRWRDVSAGLDRVAIVNVEDVVLLEVIR